MDHSLLADRDLADPRRADASSHRLLPEGSTGWAGWATVAVAAGAETAGRESLPRLWLDWAAGCVLVYGILFGVGGLLFGSPARAGATLLGGILAGSWLYRDLTTRGWEVAGR